MAAFATAARAERHDAAISGDSGRADVTRESLNAKGRRAARGVNPHPGFVTFRPRGYFAAAETRWTVKRLVSHFLSNRPSNSSRLRYSPIFLHRRKGALVFPSLDYSITRSLLSARRTSPFQPRTSLRGRFYRSGNSIVNDDLKYSWLSQRTSRTRNPEPRVKIVDHENF